jgi:EAL domain-containing protein (putative c-di-GMP-specific phosphodiesterase class I)
MAGIIRKPIDADALRDVLERQAHVDLPLSPERLRAAIDAKELVLHYQPIIDLRDGVVTGVEALMRWQHPQLGLVMPSAFIPMAERAGIVGLLTDWALAEAVRQAGLWQRAGLKLKIAVNISIANAPDEGLPERLQWMCEHEGIAPSSISLELTESATMRDPARLMELFTRFRLKGFDLSIDDFGTGYSSLVHLQRLPFSALKIDQSFVASMLVSESGAAIVIAVIGLARALGLKCIAEGVESQAMVEFLKANGCDFVQGYHMAQPMPADEIPVFLAA